MKAKTAARKLREMLADAYAARSPGGLKFTLQAASVVLTQVEKRRRAGSPFQTRRLTRHLPPEVQRQCLLYAKACHDGVPHHKLPDIRL